MTNPSSRPERQSRARSQLGADEPGHREPRQTTELAERRTVDLDRLRDSAASAITNEQARTPAGSAAPASAGAALGPDATARTPRWLKVAAPIGVLAALGTVGATVLGGGSDPVQRATASHTTTAPAATTASSTAAPATTAPPTTALATTGAASTEATTPVPTTAPVAPAADASAAPTHRATYRAGKLYLEGRIASDEEAQRYVSKAAAVLGPDNVVNQYVVDPSVPTSTDGTVDVDEPFLFDTGSSELNPQYTGVLGLGVAALKLNPAARMIVTGYTDSQGDPTKNQALSLARATSVADYLVVTGGIDRSRIDAVGAGDRDPVGDNGTEAGRKLNRRIEVKLVNLLG